MRRSGFSLEDVLEEFVEASSKGREYLEADGYRFDNRYLPPKQRFSPAEYLEWLRRTLLLVKSWRKRNPERYKAWVSIYNKTPEQKKARSRRFKRWWKNNSEKAKRRSKNQWTKIKSNPARLAKKRAANKLAARRRRARLKRGSPGQAVNGGR